MGNYNESDHAVMREYAQKRYVKERPEYANSSFNFQIMSDFDGNGHVAVWPMSQGSDFELQYSFSKLREDVLAARFGEIFNKKECEVVLCLSREGDSELDMFIQKLEAMASPRLEEYSTVLEQERVHGPKGGTAYIFRKGKHQYWDCRDGSPLGNFLRTFLMDLYGNFYRLFVYDRDATKSFDEAGEYEPEFIVIDSSTRPVRISVLQMTPLEPSAEG